MNFLTMRTSTRAGISVSVRDGVVAMHSETELLRDCIRFDAVHYQEWFKEQLLNFIPGSPIYSKAESECSVTCSSNKTVADRNPWISILSFPRRRVYSGQWCVLGPPLIVRVKLSMHLQVCRGSRSMPRRRSFFLRASSDPQAFSCTPASEIQIHYRLSGLNLSTTFRLSART